MYHGWGDEQTSFGVVVVNALPPDGAMGSGALTHPLAVAVTTTAPRTYCVQLFPLPLGKLIVSAEPGAGFAGESAR